MEKIILLNVLFIGIFSQSSAEEYKLIDLGSLPGRTDSSAYDLNDSGQVVGVSYTPGQNNSRAFLWTQGEMIDLGTFGGDRSFAYGINEAGQIVGFSTIFPNGRHAFLWDNGNMIDLGTLGGDNSIAHDINDAEQIVGFSALFSNEIHAFLWDSSNMIDLGTLGGDRSIAYGINNFGQIVGSSRTSSGGQHAFLWDNGNMIDLGALGERTTWGPGWYDIIPGACTDGFYPCVASHAQDINGLSQIVGGSETGNGDEFQAFIWKNGAMTALGTLGGIRSTAYGINNSNQVVGISLTNSINWHGFIWEDGEITDLNDLISDSSFGVLQTARDINEHGQIIVDSAIDEYTTHATILIPTKIIGDGSNSLENNSSNFDDDGGCYFSIMTH